MFPSKLGFTPFLLVLFSLVSLHVILLSLLNFTLSPHFPLFSLVLDLIVQIASTFPGKCFHLNWGFTWSTWHLQHTWKIGFNTPFTHRTEAAPSVHAASGVKKESFCQVCHAWRQDQNRVIDTPFPRRPNCLSSFSKNLTKAKWFYSFVHRGLASSFKTFVWDVCSWIVSRQTLHTQIKVTHTGSLWQTDIVLFFGFSTKLGFVFSWFLNPG